MLPPHEADALTIRLRDTGRLVARLTSSHGRADDQRTVVLQHNAKAWQEGVYDALHTLDDFGADVIVIDAPPNSPEWTAVNDRLSRACARAVKL
jgi:L-threonylcarbamoyladenylate synthase